MICCGRSCELLQSGANDYSSMAQHTQTPEYPAELSMTFRDDEKIVRQAPPTRSYNIACAVPTGAGHAVMPAAMSERHSGRLAHTWLRRSKN
jgi:hypothetical protein